MQPGLDGLVLVIQVVQVLEGGVRSRQGGRRERLKKGMRGQKGGGEEVTEMEGKGGGGGRENTARKEVSCCNSLNAKLPLYVCRMM